MRKRTNELRNEAQTLLSTVLQALLTHASIKVKEHCEEILQELYIKIQPSQYVLCLPMFYFIMAVLIYERKTFI